MIVKDLVVSTPEDFINELVRIGHKFGTYATPDGEIVLCFRKSKDGFYSDEKGVALLVDIDDISHLMNVIRLARRRARKVQYENETRCIED